MAASEIELDALAAGDDVATDLIAAKHYQYVKMTYGATGTATEVTSTATNPFPVALSDVDNAVLDASAASLAAIEAAVGGNYAEDTAHVTGDEGIFTLAVRNDAIAALAGTDGDYAPFQVNATGELYTTDEGSEALLTTIDADTSTIAGDTTSIDSKITACNTGAVVISSGTVTANAGTGTFTVDLGANNDVTATGNVAHDAVDSGAPIKVGGKAKAFDSTPPGTNVAEDDRVDAIFTLSGQQYVETSHPNHWDVSVDYAVAQTNATVKAAPGAGLRLFITDVIVSNGATAGNITLLDGSAGTVLLELYPAINGGLTHSFRSPIALTANTLLAITSTTVTTHSVTVTGFIAA